MKKIRMENIKACSTLLNVNLTACNKRAVESLNFYRVVSTNLRTYVASNYLPRTVKENKCWNPLCAMAINIKPICMTRNSLFGGMDAVEITKPEIPYAPEWSPLEKLNKERDLIGMYLSAHPLDEYEFEINHVCNCTTVDLADSSPL